MSEDLDDTWSAAGDDERVVTLAELPVGALFAARYRVEAQIGRGGMGTVYRVLDEKLGEAVALKLLTLQSERAIERFLREVRLARRVTHPNVARTHDLGEQGGVHFLTMEYVRGTPLDDLLDERGALSAERLREIGAQIADGLAAAHGAGVVHRDLKPANVLVAEDGRVVLTDFGIARATSAESGTQTGTLIGTPHYMSPEQVMGKTADERSDLYALGLMLYEMATGVLPFDEADTPIGIAMARLHRTPSDPREHVAGLPSDLADLILRCLAREPDARPQSALDARAAITGGSIARAHTPSSGSRQSLYAPVSVGACALAVLPFSYRGPSEHDYLGEGLAEELIDVLSRTRELKVLALGATRRFAEDRDPARIGRELEADVVVDGTLQLSGARMRLTVRLLQSDGVQRWTERFDGAFEDVFELQESVARRVAEALRVEVYASHHRHTAPPEAVELYLRARRLLRADIMTEAGTAVKMLDRALALAPGFAPAIPAHAIASIRAWWGPTPDSEGGRKQRAIDSVARAEREAPELAETHLVSAMLAVQGGEFRKAATSLARALEIAPTMVEAHQYLAELQLESGRLNEGRKRMQLALELDPSLSICHLALAREAALRGDWETCERHMAKLTQKARTLPVLVSELRQALYRGATAGVKRVADMLDDGGGEPGKRMRELARVAVDGEGLEQAFEMMTLIPAWLANRRFTSLIQQIAIEVFAAAGEEDAALTVLEQCVAGILIDIRWMRTCPLLEGLRATPRFASLEAQVAERAADIWRKG